MPNSTDVIQVGQIQIRFQLEAHQTDGRLTAFDYLIPVNARVPVAHSHEAFDETVYAVAGVTSVTVEGHTTALQPGEVLFVPRGTVHHVENVGTEDARGFSVITPGLLGPTYFREVAEIVNVGGPPDVRRVAGVMQRHGLRPVHGS